ncbi:MAG: SixA phosphatase family protein [Steroidobacteraceae bacterium]
MKRLTLMRHGDAQWKDLEVADFARPLNRRGTSEAEAMARRLTELTLVPDLIIASPARRAQQTAETLARQLALGPRSIRYEEALYLGGAQEILQLARTIGPRVLHLMIIGHNPGISELAHLLAPGGELGTAALRTITFDTDQWSTVGPSVVKDVLNETPPSRLFGLFA